MKISKNMMKILFLLILITGIFAGCEDVQPDPYQEPDDNTGEEVSEEALLVNKFIKDYMEFYYLWNEQMPYIDYTKQPDPFKYFDSLLYKPTDRWSFITDDYEALANSYEGIEESMGHSFILYKYSNSDGVFGIIQFVFPGSPAEEAGLKRGDLFTAIDGTDLNVDNYSTLLDKQKYSLTIARLEGNTVVPYMDVNLTARVIIENPVLYYDTLNIDNTVIGYLVYKNFTSTFDDSLTSAFEWLYSAGIDEMVLDLRYNNGGAISSMQHLASILAPIQQKNNKDIIITDEYNRTYTQYRLSRGLSSDTKFLNISPSMNLSRIFILTGQNSASASEALIIGLEPYMDVITLGEQTRGKYTGAYVIYDTEKKHNWAIQPIVFKYANSVGFSDFPDGLTPDFAGSDDLYHDLGSLQEGLLALAIEQITGSGVAIVPKSASIVLNASPIQAFDGNKPRLDIPLLKINDEN
ncbi:MAG: hypothetical protein JXR31_00360 [Prolixibacteraceae bacterium]|nr:hypothetical protein [Prolixibacteraceae bacterium]MBN2772666.1 hypothetical protein [Prolixibacteraceae bacterium]